MKNTFQLRNPESERMGVAIGAVLEGPGFQYDGVWVHFEGERLRCDAIASPTQSLDDDRATQLIERASSVLDALMLSSGQFSALVGSQPVRFGVVEDYGTGWIPVVELGDAGLEWTRRRSR